MTKDDVVNDLITLLEELQKDIGDESCTINLETRPLLEIKHFDSLAAISFSLSCAARFGIDENKIFGEKEMANGLFTKVNKAGKNVEALTVSEVADRIISLME